MNNSSWRPAKNPALDQNGGYRKNPLDGQTDNNKAVHFHTRPELVVKPASLNARKALLALLILAVPFAFLWDFVLYKKVFYFFDIEISWIPMHQFVRNALLAGQSILWNPYVMLGFPQHAES